MSDDPATPATPTQLPRRRPDPRSSEERYQATDQALGEFIAARGVELIACAAVAGKPQLARELAAVMGVTIDQVVDRVRQELATRKDNPSGG